MMIMKLFKKMMKEIEVLKDKNCRCKNLQYEWIDLDKIDEYNILPGCLKDILKQKEDVIHVINNDLK